MTPRTFRFPVTAVPKLATLASGLTSGQLSAEFATPSLNAVTATGNRPLEATSDVDSAAQIASPSMYADLTDVLQNLSNWTPSVPYDSTRRRISWVAGPAWTQGDANQVTQYLGTRFISYDLGSDTWTQRVNPFNGVAGGALSANSTVHGYDNQFIYGNRLYKRGIGNGERSNIFVYDLDSLSLVGEIAQPFTAGDPGDGTGMKFHPGIGAYGAIVLSTRGTVKIWMRVLTAPLGTTAPGTWTPINTAGTAFDLTLDTWHTICQYNPTSGYVLIGGGNNATTGQTTFLLIGAHSTLTGNAGGVSISTFPTVRRADSPVALGCSEGGANKGCVVPWGQGFLAFHRDGVYSLNSSTGAWTRLGNLPSAIAAVNATEFSTHRLIACAIEEHGVVALIKHGGGDPPTPTFAGNSAMWVYKP